MIRGPAQASAHIVGRQSSSLCFRLELDTGIRTRRITTLHMEANDCRYNRGLSHGRVYRLARPCDHVVVRTQCHIPVWSVSLSRARTRQVSGVGVPVCYITISSWVRLRPFSRFTRSSEVVIAHRHLALHVACRASPLATCPRFEYVLPFRLRASSWQPQPEPLPRRTAIPCMARRRLRTQATRL